MKVRTIP